MKQNTIINQNRQNLFKQRQFSLSLFFLSKKFSGFLIILVLIFYTFINIKPEKNNNIDENLNLKHLPPLAMRDGEPYIRALMLTISASEANHKNSYFLLYGGSHVHDLTTHPNQCIPIVIGVNKGKCSTAAGRYQFLSSTWEEKARQYHPTPKTTDSGLVYSFEPQYQDLVVYGWLKDHHQWNIDILTLLKEDRIEEVLAQLSGVWTSLGSGIEDNSMTPYLPQLYRQFLAQELKYQKK